MINTAIKDGTRGGQIIRHYFQMFGQVFKHILFKLGIVVAIGYFGFQVSKIDYRYIGDIVEHKRAHLMLFFCMTKAQKYHCKIDFNPRNPLVVKNKWYRYRSYGPRYCEDLIKDRGLLKSQKIVLSHLQTQAIRSLYICLGFIVLAFLLLVLTGRKIQQ